MAKVGLQVVSRNRRAPLTDSETVCLGRQLRDLLGVEHVSYPHATPTVVVEIWGFRRALPAEARASIESVIGPFDISLVEA